ncbi:hypothetical protein CIB84_016764 [Bambusicola thoracicus]|uniref:RNA-directed DNA polymerase n=1 Tax=Bambusicola thoracicus TaxID=9083 RepID=A0A2P4S5U2_BAMTH|nr:hypothetical protein CIB84_016764 [Bambusicola thoracicus]
MLPLVGTELGGITIELEQQSFQSLCKNAVSVQAALSGFPGTVTTKQHTSYSQLFQLVAIIPVIPLAFSPVQGPTVFTDAAGKTKRYAIAWQEANRGWQTITREDQSASVQQLELKAILLAFESFPRSPIDIVTDSQYCFRMAWLCKSCCETCTPTATALYNALARRSQPIFIMHVNSHQELPGFIVEGNRVADAACYPALLYLAEAAKQSHSQFHQPAMALHRTFHIPLTMARDIILACPACGHSPPFPAGVNPRGLRPNELWQMDVTDVPDFGRLRHVHVVVDTCSGMIWATALAGQKARQCVQVLRIAVAVLGAPDTLKTDNGPGYCSQIFGA